VTVGWTAPGDDWLCGTAAKLRVLASENPIQRPTEGTVLLEEDATVAAGEVEERVFTGEQIGGARFLAVLYRDEAGNWGHLASVEIPPAEGGGEEPPGEGQPPGGGPPEGGGGPSPGPGAGPCANLIRGSAGNDKLTGTDAGDRIAGRRGRDRIKGRAGDDCLRGGRGRDRLGGGPGEDRIHVRGGGRDRVRCGPGEDTVVASKHDRVRGCEEVKR
jgi:hypothetical protein